MEFLTILLSSVLAGISPAGLILDEVIENALISQVEGVETLEVRVTNVPSYRIVQGKFDRIQIASRGMFLTPESRIEVLEVETDPLYIDLQQFRQGEGIKAFQEPVQGAVRLVLTEADLNQGLRSPRIQARFQQAVDRVAQQLPGTATQKYNLISTSLDFLEEDRFQVQVQLQTTQESTGEVQTLDLLLESRLIVASGYQLQLVEPKMFLNGEPIAPFLVGGFVGALSRRLDLRTLEESGILTRILQLELESDRLEVAAFFRISENGESQESPTVELEE